MQTGFARTGDMFACDHEGVVPDLIVTAKGIAGGLPLSAVTGRAEIMDAPHVGGLGGTYGGNPLACAAALAVDRDDRGRRPRRPGPRDRQDHARPARPPCRQRDPRIGDVRGRGAMVAVELVQARHHRARRRPDPARSPRPRTPQGLVVLTCGTYGNVLRFLPPLSIPDHLLAEGLDVLEQIFNEHLMTTTLQPGVIAAGPAERRARTAA